MKMAKGTTGNRGSRLMSQVLKVVVWDLGPSNSMLWMYTSKDPNAT